MSTIFDSHMTYRVLGTCDVMGSLLSVFGDGHQPHSREEPNFCLFLVYKHRCHCLLRLGSQPSFDHILWQMIICLDLFLFSVFLTCKTCEFSQAVLIEMKKRRKKVAKK